VGKILPWVQQHQRAISGVLRQSCDRRVDIAKTSRLRFNGSKAKTVAVSLETGQTAPRTPDLGAIGLRYCVPVAQE